MRGFQHWLKAKGSHNTVIIMSLKRVTSGSWGALSSTESHLFLSFAPRDTDNALSFHLTICPSFSWELRLCVCVCVPGAVVWCWEGCGAWGWENRWQPSGNGWGMFWMGNLPPFLMEYLGVCPSPVVQEAQRGRERWNENRWWFVA